MPRPTPSRTGCRSTSTAARRIDRVVVYTVQDNYTNPIEPTDTHDLLPVWHQRLHRAGLEWFGLGDRWPRSPATTWSSARVTFAAVHHRSHPDQRHQCARLATRASPRSRPGAWPAASLPATTTTLSSSGTPAAVGTAVIFTATVTGDRPDRQRQLHRWRHRASVAAAARRRWQRRDRHLQHQQPGGRQSQHRRQLQW